MSPQAFDTVIVRFGGEIGIKAPWTRKQYERRLTRNIRAALKHHAIPYSAFVKKAGRLYIKTKRAEETADKLSLVFGVSSLSPADETSSELDDILNASTRLANLQFKPNKSFAIRCQRVGKHPYTSQDICTKIGDRLLSSLPKLKMRVNLTQPEQTLQAEIREERAYLFTDVVKGPGGLPLGTQPKLVCLLKGDVQSTIASWMAMKRGCPTVLVHLEKASLTPQASTRNAIAHAQKLMEWNIGFPRRLRVIEYDAAFQKLAEDYPLQLASLLCKRLMFRIAQRIADITKAEGIVTGDSLGFSPNQTLHAYKLQDEAIRGCPIYRPLLGLNATETQETARMIRLRETAHKRGKPEAEVTQAEMAAIKLDDIKQAEAKFNVESALDNALKSLRVLKL